MQNHAIVTMAKGLCVGGTMLVPGVSGGSMCMILGIYSDLISNVSSFMKHKRKSFFFLLVFSVGAILGMVLLAKPLLLLIERYPMPTLYFFIGAVVGGIPLIYRNAKIRKVTWRIVVYPCIGILCVYLLSLIPAGIFSMQEGAGIAQLWPLAVAGVIAAVALVLPGISISYMLLLLGMYDEAMQAISQCYLPYLLPLGIGLVLGIILTTKVLERAMNRYPQPTYLVILGFILASVAGIFPGLPSGVQLLFCLGMLCMGFLAIWLISRLS